MDSDFERYVGLYSADLTRLCISLCCNNHDAEDLFQETWFKAMKNYKSYNSDLPFDKWLFSICVNTFKNKRKLFYHRNKVDFKSDEEKQAFFNSIPNTSDEKFDSYFELHSAVAELPKKLKIVVVLYYFKDYSAKEIAGILGIPEGTVKSRMQSAREQIKRRLNCE